MTSTDNSLTVLTERATPAVILVDPQLGENIGMVARAMLNCGLNDLRLVRPRDGWPNARAISAASGADSVMRRPIIQHNGRCDYRFIISLCGNRT